MKTNKKHLFGVAVILAAITFAFIGCSDDGGDKGPTEHEIAAANFKDEHSEALELDIEDVSTAHEAIVNAALDAHDDLHQSVKDLLTDEKDKLDNLKAKIDELKAASTPEQLAETFTTYYEDALDLTTTTVTIYDESKVNAALNAYELLDEEVKELLEDEKTLLDELKAKIDELKATSTPEQLAATFKTDNADALALDVGAVSIEHEAIVNAALNAYELLGENVKELLTDEKDLLDDLKAKINELKQEAANQAAAASFKSTHAIALALDIDEVTADDEVIVFAALEAFELLSEDAKALLAEEKALLDSLKEKIDGLVIRTAEAWNAAVTAINGGGNGTSSNQKYYTLTIGGDFELAGSTSNMFSPSYITVTLKGRGTISLSSNGNLIRIGNNQTLVIDSETLTLKGRSDNNNSVLYVTGTNAKLEIYNGTIKDNSSSSYGGGVYVTSGTFTMSGGSISDNTTSSSFGGGVYVTSGTFTMSGGSISDNTASGNGGGVYADFGTFTMSGGSISDNTASGNGGGVYARSTFTMNGGSISDNTASTYGGGVYVYSGTFTMNGGSISDNSTPSAYGGGGVYVSSGTFTMNGGSISDNTASGNGGGVYVYNDATFIMRGGSITGNKAAGNNSIGGGVYFRKTISAGGEFTKANSDTGNSGIISNNTATYINGQQVARDFATYQELHYVNDPLGETDELSTTDTNSGWLSE